MELKYPLLFHNGDIFVLQIILTAHSNQPLKQLFRESWIKMSYNIYIFFGINKIFLNWIEVNINSWSQITQNIMKASLWMVSSKPLYINPAYLIFLIFFLRTQSKDVKKYIAIYNLVHLFFYN